MEKIIYLARKLKAFAFEDIFMLAEMRKDALEQNLAELVKSGILKQDSQGYVFIDFKQQNKNQQKTKIVTFIETSKPKMFREKQSTEKPLKPDKKVKQAQNFGIFITQKQNVKPLSFNGLILNFLEKYVAKYCTPSTFQTYESLFRNNILPFFKSKSIENVDINTIKEFYHYCENKQLSPRRFKNTMALLKQLLTYAKEVGYSNSTFDFQVKRLSPKNEFNINRIKFESGVLQCS